MIPLMRTGLLQPDGHDVNTLDTLQKVVALMKVLMTEAVKTAAVFVEACGRTAISARDITCLLYTSPSPRD